MYHDRNTCEVYLFQKDLEAELANASETESILCKWFTGRLKNFPEVLQSWKQSSEIGTFTHHFPTWWGRQLVELLKEKVFLLLIALAYSQHCHVDYMQFEDRANPRYILFSYNEGGVKLVKNLHDMEFDEELSK
jgi:hypothetical protein